MTTFAISSPSINVGAALPRRNDLPNIAFLGKAGAGKTTGAEYLSWGYGYTCTSFAYLMKQIAVMIWGPEAEKDREKLVGVGQGIRKLDPNAWVNATERQLDELRNPVVIDDCRMENEYYALWARGFKFIRVEAPEEVRVARLIANGKFQNHEQLQHVTETTLDGFPTNVSIPNDGDDPSGYHYDIEQTIERFRKQVA